MARRFAFGDRFYNLEHGDSAPSAGRYTGLEPLDGEIDILGHAPDVPPQPSWE